MTHSWKSSKDGEIGMDVLTAFDYTALLLMYKNRSRWKIITYPLAITSISFVNDVSDSQIGQSLRRLDDFNLSDNEISTNSLVFKERLLIESSSLKE